jgi:hypothetical protein
MKKEIRHINDLYDKCGGVMQIASDFKVHSRTVERWRLGIPEHYWAKLDDLYGIKPYECFKLNAKLKGYRVS